MAGTKIAGTGRQRRPGADAGAADDSTHDNRFTALRTRVRRLPGGFLAWRIGITVLGVAIIAGGIVLLPLPGPGWLIIFGGLGLLATEYTWAKRLLRFGRAQLARWTAWVKARPRWAQAAIGLAGLVLLAAVFYLVYRVLYA